MKVIPGEGACTAIEFAGSNMQKESIVGEKNRN
jgi:hypothetical protein